MVERWWLIITSVAGAIVGAFIISACAVGYKSDIESENIMLKSEIDSMTDCKINELAGR
jgi:hypothetical protein